MLNETVQTISPDGQWAWNGTEWVPNSALPSTDASTVSEQPKHRRGLKIAAGVFGVLAFLTIAGAVGGESDGSATEPAGSTVTQGFEVEDAAAKAAADAEEAAAKAAADAEKAAAAKESVSQKNAVRSGESYLTYMAFSRSGLISQLEFEGYSTADATYAVDKINPDWNKQAAKSAKEYLEFSGFSRSGLIDQLKFEGYTNEQAVYGVTEAGL